VLAPIKFSPSNALIVTKVYGASFADSLGHSVRICHQTKHSFNKRNNPFFVARQQAID
jgi:hypothetical protein